MPEISTYDFSHRELLALLIRAAGVADGRWQLQVTFGFAAGNFGPNEEGLSPGGMVVVDHVGITKARPDSPSGLVMSVEEAKDFSPTVCEPPSAQSPPGAPAS
ncbi:MAG: hypothetical protein ACTHOR_04725 [Devosia sp.]|jgi:hypothetical protein